MVKPTISFANGGSVAIVDKPADPHKAPDYQYNLNTVGLDGKYKFVSTGENFWQCNSQ